MHVYKRILWQYSTLNKWVNVCLFIFFNVSQYEQMLFDINIWQCLKSVFIITLNIEWMSEDAIDSCIWPCKAFWKGAFSSDLIWKMNVAFNESPYLTWSWCYTSLCIHELPYWEWESVCGRKWSFFNMLFHKQPFLCVFISARAQMSDTRRSPSLRLYKQKD